MPRTRDGAGTREGPGRSEGRTREETGGEPRPGRRSPERAGPRGAARGTDTRATGTRATREDAGERGGGAPERGTRGAGPAGERGASREHRGRGAGAARAGHGPRQEPRPPLPRQQQPKPGLESRMRPRPRFEAAEYRPAGKLQGKVALVTGGDSGIGRAVAVLYAREGADVAIVYLPQEEQDAQETRRHVEEAGQRALLIPGDVTDPSFCNEAVERTVDELGSLDVLVNNAAFQQSQEDVGKISDEQWEHTFRTNIFAYFYLARAALGHMRPGGAIVNTSSVTALQGSPHLLDYSSTKGAIVSFTRSLAQNLVPRGIRVNCVAPGPVWTPLNPSDKPADKVEKFGSDVPMGRPAQPEEIAPAYVYFASEADSSYVTGVVLGEFGGESMPT